MKAVSKLTCPCDRPDPAPAFQYDQPPSGETHFDWRGQAYRRGYRCCRNCGHWVAEIAMDLTDFYKGGYVDGTYGARMKDAFCRILALPEERSDNAARVRRVRHFLSAKLGNSRSPSLLDVGSGLAVFPFRMREAGWRVTALDPDARAAEHAETHAGVPAIHADFMVWEPAAHAHFDVITLNKVLEHVENPVGMLAKACRWVRRGGFIYVEVPDAAAARVGPEREEFFIEHLHVFSKTSLKLASARAGLTVEACDALREPSGKFSLFAFMSKYEDT